MRLGTSTNLFAHRRSEETELPYIEQMRQCSAAGFKVLDLNLFDAANLSKKGDLARDDWELCISALGNEAAKLGVVFSQAHAPTCPDFFVNGRKPSEEYIARFNEMTRRTVIACEMLGIKWLTVHPLDDNINTEYDTTVIQKTNIDFYTPLVEAAMAHGFGIAFENMPELNRSTFRRSYGSTTDDLCALVDSFKDASVGITWDFGHARTVMNDQCRQLRRIGKRLKSTHVQDCTGNCDSHLIPFVGGNIKWEQIMPCLKEIGYEGDFVFECFSFMNDIPDALRPSAAKLAYDFGVYCLKLCDGE